jgi:phosphoadenosine phosphosulfate reductase
MNTHAADEFTRWPKYKESYIRAFDRMLAVRRERGLRENDQWQSGESVMDWWINPTRREKEDENQIQLDYDADDPQEE